MLLIGEKLNSSIPKTLALLEPFQEAEVSALVQAQIKAGAQVLDLNAALCTNERETLQKLYELVRASGAVPMFDSPSEEVLCEMLEASEGDCILNSVTLHERRERLVPLARQAIESGRRVGIVALPLADTMPQTMEEREANIRSLLDALLAEGIPAQNLYLDLLVEAIAADHAAAHRALQTLRFVREVYPTVNTISGLSNVSFGLPMREKLNAAFALLLFREGMTGAILDPTNALMRASLASLKALTGEDEYCMEYISLYREMQS